MLSQSRPQITTDALLIQQCRDAQSGGRMLSIAIQRHLEYCALWHFDYKMQIGPVRHFDPMDAWQKFGLVQEAMHQHYKYIVWLDIDAMIVDMGTDLRDGCIGPCNMVRWDQPLNHYQAGVMLFKNEGSDAYSLVCHLLEERKYYLSRYPTIRGWYEQGQMNEVNETSPELFHELPIAWNWSSHYCPPIDAPIIQSWHGTPDDVRLPEMQTLVNYLNEPVFVERHEAEEADNG